MKIIRHSIPAVPPIVREPLRLGQVPIPSRFFLAPLAGYTSLAFRLAVRECGGLGLATTDLVNARSLIERPAPGVRAGRDLRARPPALDPDLRDRRSPRWSRRPAGGRAGGFGRRYQHGLPGQKSGQDRRRLGPHVPDRIGPSISSPRSSRR